MKAALSRTVQWRPSSEPRNSSVITLLPALSFTTATAGTALPANRSFRRSGSISGVRQAFFWIGCVVVGASIGWGAASAIRGTSESPALGSDVSAKRAQAAQNQTASNSLQAPAATQDTKPAERAV